MKTYKSLVGMKTGFACARKHLVVSEQGQPHLRPFNIGTRGELNLTEVFYIPQDFITDWDSYTLEPGHILFNNTNSVELVGKTALVRNRLAGSFSNHITRLSVYDTANVGPSWLALSLRWLWQMGDFSARCNRWIGQAGFNTSALEKTEIPIPYPDDPVRSLAEQRRIVARLEALLGEVREMRALVEAMRADAEQLEQSILAQAFRGEA